MKLKATFYDLDLLNDCNSGPSAIIYKEDGEIIFNVPAKDAREAQVRCLENGDTRKFLFERLNVVKLPRIEWIDYPDADLYVSAQDGDQVLTEPMAATPQDVLGALKMPEQPTESIFRDVPMKMSPDAFEEKVKRLIVDLEENDIQVENERQKHKDTMKELEKIENEIKGQLYDARRGNLKTTVECKIVMDYEAGMKQIVRIDTGEIIEEHEMSADEKQISALPAPETSETFPLEVAPNSPVIFDVFDGQEWVAMAPGKIRAGDKFRMFKNKILVDILDRSEFVSVKNARKTRATGVVNLECR